MECTFCILKTDQCQAWDSKKMGVLYKVDYSDSPMVYIKTKSKEIRVWVDFSMGLNDSLKNYHNPLPGPGEVFEKLSRSWTFSKIDLSTSVDWSGWRMFQTTYNKHTRGIYKFNCLAFEIKIVPVIFQQIMDMKLSGLDLAVAYVDNILLKSENPEHIKIFLRLSEGFRIIDSSWKKKNANYFLWIKSNIWVK